MSNIETATATVAELEKQRADLSAREIELATEAKRLSYHAVTGDELARKAIAKIDAEEAKLQQQMRHLNDAIGEAKRRVAEAQHAESLVALRANAEEALTLAKRVEHRGRAIAALVDELVHELKETTNDARAFTALGAPAVPQQTLKLALTRTILADLREGGLDVESIPPGQRHDPGELIGGYAAQAVRWAVSILAKEAA